MAEYRLYIDEPSDHIYRNLEKLDRHYLGLTGVLIHQAYYNPTVPDGLEELKKRFFTYDPDRFWLDGNSSARKVLSAF